MALRRNQHCYRAAKRLRRTMSLPEVLLWRELRRKAGGCKFRNQHPVGNYVIDFYCPAAKLGVEGGRHRADMGDRPDRDARRDAFLAEQGIAICRIAATDVLKSPSDVAEAVVGLCTERLG